MRAYWCLTKIETITVFINLNNWMYSNKNLDLMSRRNFCMFDKYRTDAGWYELSIIEKYQYYLAHIENKRIFCFRFGSFWPNWPICPCTISKNVRDMPYNIQNIHLYSELENNPKFIKDSGAESIRIID